MPININNIITVTIERGTLQVARAGFGIPFIFGEHSKWTEDYRSYNSLDAVAEDFTTSDLEYKKAAAIFAQNPRPQQIIIGRRIANQKQKNRVTVNTAVTGDYTVVINGTPFSYAATVPTDTEEVIVDQLIIAINAGSEPVALFDNGDNFDIEADVSGVGYSLALSGDQADNMSITGTLANVAIDAVVSGKVYSVKINNKEYSYTATPTDTFSDIVDGLIAAISGNEPVTLTDNGANFDIVGDPTSLGFTIDEKEGASDMILAKTLRVNRNVATEIARIQTVSGGNDWYFLILTTTTQQDILDAAAYIETQLKTFGVLGVEPEIITTSTTDIASQLKALNYDRTFIIYTSDSDNHKEAAWIGKNAPKDPGSITWAFKNMSGIVADDLSQTEYNNATGKNCNVYVEMGGVSIPLNGVVVSGEYIDIIRGTDWIQSNLESDLYSNFVNNQKVPYTQAGIDSIKSIVSGILRRAISQGILTNDPEPVVTAPLIQDVPVADKTGRILRNVDFTGFYSGAIHKVQVNGKISV